jgi:hypothetical protein
MKIEQEYINKLLLPLDDAQMPTLSEYITALEMLGLTIADDYSHIDRKFESHLRYLCTNGNISDADGNSNLKSMGFRLGVGGYLTIIGSKYIMKVDKEAPISPNSINIGAINGQQVQVGNHNNQVANINIQELVEEVAKSNDSDAKNKLKILLANSTVGSVIGAGVSTLIGML